MGSRIPDLTPLLSPADADEMALWDASAEATVAIALSVLKTYCAMSAADILTAIKTVDGSGSGLDADTLDGQSSAAFAAARAAMSQAEAEAGSDTTVKDVTAQRLRQAANAAIAAWVGAAPGALDTLDELAAALGDDANYAATITTALSGKQPLDATLTALAALTVAADKLIYATGSDTFATADLTSLGRTLLAAANAGALARASVEAAVSLSYSGSLTPNCNDGLHRKVTMTGDLAVNAPSNGADGMVWRGRFTASGAARELTFHSDIKKPYGSTYEATVESGATRIIHLEHDGTRWVMVRNLEFAA